MRALIITLVSLTLAACAGTGDRDRVPAEVKLRTMDLAEPVDRVYLPTLNSWRPVDRSHVILYQSPNKPFLVTLKRPVTSPFFNDLAIGVRRTGSHLSKFDYVIVEGWRHYIESITPLTREQADALS